MRVKISIVTLLLGLLFIKVSAFHVYAHQNTDNQIEICGYCDLAIENQQAELSPDLTPIDFTERLLDYPTLRFYLSEEDFTPLHHSAYLFTRPPPVVV